MAFEKVLIDDTRKAELTRDGFPWKRHNGQILGAIGALNTRIGALEKDARQSGAPNGLWDRALALRNAGEKLIEALIDSDESLVRTVPVAKPKSE